MAKQNFDKKQVEEWAKSLKDAQAVQSELESSISKYTTSVQKLMALQKNIQHIESVRLKQQKNLHELEDSILNLLDSKIGKSKEEKKQIREQIKELNKKIKAQKISLSITNENLDIIQKETTEYKKQVQSVNKLNLSFNSIIKGLKTTPALIKSGFGQLKGLNLMSMDKSIRSARLEMGIFTKQGDSFYDSISKASESTNDLGIGVEELAKMQAHYSSEIGRSVTFTEANAKAMAELAKGTNLGAEGAASMASEMDNFGVSMEGTRDYIQDAVNTAHEMGLNSSKVIKNIQNNLKLANKYNFKNGIKGLAHMAQLSTKFKMDMGSVAGMADKLFNIEGAVEMSAQLQVLGGEWAKLADPFKLMYQAREDMDGLFESVVNATKGAATFNKETGEFKLSGLELHKLKTVAEATGLSYEDLAQAAKQAAKYSKIKASMNVAIDEKTSDFIASISQFDAKNGKFYFEVNGEKQYIDSLNSNSKAQIKTIMDQKATLKEQAEQARNFEDEWSSTINLLKIAVLPFVKAINKELSPALIDFRKTIKSSGFVDGIKSFAKGLGSFAGDVIKPIVNFIGEFPKLSTALLAAFGPATWLMKGIALGKGFMMSTGGFGKGGGGGILDSLGMGGKGGKGKFSMKGGKFGMGSWGSNLKGIGAGLGLGAAGMGLDYGREQLEDPDSGLGKGLGVAGKAASWAGMGAMAGPWGALIAGIGGALKGTYDEYFADKTSQNSEPKTINDGIVQNGEVKAVTNSRDVTMAMKPNGPLANTLGNKHQNSNKMEVKFQPIKIEFGDIKISSDNSSIRLNLQEDKVFIRDLTRKIQESLRESINGGKLNPNPL